MREEARKADLHSFEARYFERMASSLGDKAKLIKYLPAITDPANPPKVLDIGAGGGEFANALSEAGYAVTALDASDDAVVRIREKFPTITTATLLANHTHELGEGVFDVVICSSILHEVFSYGDDIHSRGHMSSLARAFESFRKALKPGGLLLIRDGVLPENWNDAASFNLLEGHENTSVETYLDMCPFANGRAYGEQGTLVNLTSVTGKTYAGNVRSVLEFAYTYTWGLDSYPRETQELYAVKTLAEYDTFLEDHGFVVEESFSYLQPGYPANLAEKMTLKVNEAPSEWFDSNAIWVARKA